MTDYWSETIKEFDGLITYPKLEEKYLKRPPFKYILSIFQECCKISNINDAGEIKLDDQSKEYYDSSEKKMDFIKKVGKIVYENNSAKMPVKAQSILKGVESDLVNVFLRDLAVFTKKNIKNKNQLIL